MTDERDERDEMQSFLCWGAVETCDARHEFKRLLEQEIREYHAKQKLPKIAYRSNHHSQ